ncbi:MAG: GNAT family N-acetyltransferase [Agriterribacter sp.]
MTTFKRTNSGDIDFKNLVTLLDKDLAIRDGADHAFYNQFNKIDMIRNAIVCYAEGKPIGCGAFKKYNDSSVEIKRMYVLPEYRGRSVGSFIVNQLEQWAKELHYTACVLETGKRQPEAIRLYQKAGYIQIENFGQYKNIQNSVCMRKALPV